MSFINGMIGQIRIMGIKLASHKVVNDKIMFLSTAQPDVGA